jgi:hypothetical protein
VKTVEIALPSTVFLPGVFLHEVEHEVGVEVGVEVEVELIIAASD